MPPRKLEPHASDPTAIAAAARFCECKVFQCDTSVRFDACEIMLAGGTKAIMKYHESVLSES